MSVCGTKGILLELDNLYDIMICILTFGLATHCIKTIYYQKYLVNMVNFCLKSTRRVELYSSELLIYVWLMKKY